MSTPPIPRLHPEHTLTELTDALDEFGCCAIDGAVDPSLMDRVVADMAPHSATATYGVGDFEGVQTRRTGCVVGRSETYRKQLAMQRSLMAAGDHVLSESTTWILSAVELIEICADQPGQMLHRDGWKYDFLDLPVETELNGMWALTDFTEENGATRVVPGSHLWDHEQRARPEQTLPAEMSKGSLLLYTGKVFHGGGENISSGPRAGLSIQHCAGWLTQSEQIMLECPPAMVADWDDEFVRFIGYKMRSNALGYFGDSEDPLAAVHPDREFGQGWINDPDVNS
jgi:ectoine hydroxylase-related dioxygenase (phytanoyl-CoA dioxygenase family)